ncbi:hypothetical protein [Saliterribacillus persicus]|uniref:Uncharacterized protein n=1 Tax=Saliterribacillus persicus TaxID=930114 RepID=A0A368Y0J7_9BACI|nr:hypothetical protein [Saliterribacillus persicus]RCW73219.1 hypothetical protein DFR57_104217 [Saliterribacillus persicus]
MRLVLELFRFTFIFLLLSVVLSIISYMIYYPLIGEKAESYFSGTGAIAALIIVFFLYRRMGWGKGSIDKFILSLSIGFVVLFVILIPDFAPAVQHSSRYIYTYGFPLNFLTVYNEAGAKFLLPNLFSGGSISMDMGIVLNILIFYFPLHFLFKKTNFLTKVKGIKRQSYGESR